MVWTRPLALAAGALFLAGPVYVFSPALGGILVLVAGGASVWAFVVGVGPRLRRRDAYDLGELRRVHDAEEERALEEEFTVAGSPDRAVCPHCGEEYPHRLGTCPRCGRRG